MKYRMAVCSSFSTAGHSVAFTGELSRSTATATMMCGTTSRLSGYTRSRSTPVTLLLRQILGGWSFSQTAFLHTGLPFTVLSQPYTLTATVSFRRADRSSRGAFPGVPGSIQEDAVPRCDCSGTRQWLNPNAFISVVDPATGACAGGDSVANCQFGDSGRNTVRGPHFANSDIYHHQDVSRSRRDQLRLDAQMFNAFNHPNFALPNTVEAGVPGSFDTSKIRYAPEHNLSSYRPAGCRPGRRQFATHDRISGQNRVLAAYSVSANAGTDAGLEVGLCFLIASPVGRLQQCFCLFTRQ